MTTSYTFERLIAPTLPNDFFRKYWEAQPLVVDRHQPDYFVDLLTLDEIDRAITALHLCHPEVSLVDARRPSPSLPTAEYAYETGLIDVARLYRHFRNGCTIVLQQLHLRVPTLGALCRSMEQQLGTRFQTNIYVTPANAQGFKPHYDTHDVFVLQLHGSKHWTLYNTAVELPYRLQDFRPSEHTAGAATREFELRPGDLAYIPRGIMHDARSNDEVSMHITLGVLFTSWTDLLAQALAQVGLRDVDFRRSLPPGFNDANFDRTEARTTFRSLLAALAAKADFDAALDHFANDLVSTRHPLLPGQMQQVLDVPMLTAQSRVGARPSLLYRLNEEGESIVIHCYGGQIRFPGHAAVPLRFALQTESFCVRDMPGSVDEAGKLVLAKRLVQEGLLQILER